MHYLGLALYAEGPTDERFLGPLLLRLCVDICNRASRQMVEINDEVLVLRHPTGLADAPREERVAAAAQQALGAWSILFVHADADGDAARARQERAQPALDRLRDEFAALGQGVAVIPVRETEAWAICDGDALRSVFGSTLNDQALRLPANARAVERLADPKQCLHDAFAASHAGMRRRQSRSVHETFGALGEQVALDRLRGLQAFEALENELTQALVALRVLD
ncbi:DUF4276 family protein [Pseudorhodoferax sp. Leaf267]|uniref:DUF4276 family protein n=1 Tax=Pseudorhodoferax sp. Leaf267 TaxID=1736316 RepID=UPI0006F840D4|nr:DUF4276 family protein [Pseudorhodoferax sp. Leaf267]KQP12264.1 hypothetical protein ASF43_22430 [Pseudorhodoferax sp. Leaf267]